MLSRNPPRPDPNHLRRPPLGGQCRAAPSGHPGAAPRPARTRPAAPRPGRCPGAGEHERQDDDVRRRLSVAERPHTRLAAGTLGSAASPTLGERSRLALSCSLELGDLLVQLFLGRRQLRNLPLQLRDQPHQLVALRGREVFGLTHSQSIKTCSVPHNPLPTPIPLINYQSPLANPLSGSERRNVLR